MKRTSLVFSGFKLDMLLQIGGVGPICLLLFQLPAFLSLSLVLFGMLGVTLADSLYIGLAAAGIVPLVKRIKAADRTFKIISGMVLMALGLFFVSFTTQDMRIMPIAEWLKKMCFGDCFC